MDTGRTENGGFVVRENRFADWQEVGPEEYEIARRGAGEAFMRSAGNTLDSMQRTARDAARFYAEGFFPSSMSEHHPEAYRLSADTRAANERETELMRRSHPIAATAGQFAPDLALLPFGGGGRTVAQRAGLSALQEGTLQGLRTPDDPQAIGGAMAAGAIASPIMEGMIAGGRIGYNTVRGSRRWSDAAAQPAPGSAGIAGADDLARGAGGESGGLEAAASHRLRDRSANALFGQPAPNAELNRLADDIGFKLTPGQRSGRIAQEQFEEGAARNPGNLKHRLRLFEEPNTELATGLARKALGLERGNNLSLADFTRASDEIDLGFENFASEMTQRWRITEDDVASMRGHVLAGALGDPIAAKSVYNRFVRGFEDGLKTGDDDIANPTFDPFRNEKIGSDSLTGEGLYNLIRAVRNEAGVASGNEKGALENLLDLLETRFFRMAGKQSPAMEARIKQLNERYQVKKLFEAPGVWNGNELNVKSLANQGSRMFPQMKRNDYQNGRGQALEKPTADLIKYMQIQKGLAAQKLGNSGTPTGMLFSGGSLGGSLRNLLEGDIGGAWYYGGAGEGARSAVTAPLKWAAGQVINPDLLR